MMDQFDDLESMSESDIINKLIGFLPKAYQKIPQYRKMVENYYKGLDARPVTSYQKDEKVLITVSFLYRTLVSYNDMRTSVAEQMRKDAAFKAADPDLYYETKIQEEREEITELDRESLKSRTTEMQKLVVSQVRKLVSDVKGQPQSKNVHLQGN